MDIIYRYRKIRPSSFSICLLEDPRRLDKEIESGLEGRDSNRGDSSTRKMGERSNRAGEGVPPSSRFTVKVLFGYGS